MVKKLGFIPVIIILALAGLFLFGKGITGLVVSQDCCFPPDCYEGKKECDITDPNFTKQASNDMRSFLLGIILISITLYTFMYYRYSQKK